MGQKGPLSIKAQNCLRKHGSVVHEFIDLSFITKRCAFQSRNKFELMLQVSSIQKQKGGISG
jgi:hypothetical protein